MRWLPRQNRCAAIFFMILFHAEKLSAQFGMEQEIAEDSSGGPFSGLLGAILLFGLGWFLISIFGDDNSDKTNNKPINNSNSLTLNDYERELSDDLTAKYITIEYRGDDVILTKCRDEIYGKIRIPKNVTAIGDAAFNKCSRLTSITIPNSVTSIGRSAFSGCSLLTSITIPNSVTSIGGSAFENCFCLTSIIIPNSVTSIGGGAFRGCSRLESITIPNSVTTIGINAFCGCTSLPVERNLKYADTYLVCAVDKNQSNYIIKNGTRFIGDRAFSYCRGLTSIIIPNSVTSIGDSAFQDCSSLTSVTIPNSVTSIGDSAFQGCSGLKSINIPNSVTTMDDCVFWGCTNFPVENGIRYADSYLVEVVDKKQSTYTIKRGTRFIGRSAFKNCSGLKSITIPNSVTSIGSYAFEWCTGLTSVTIPESISSIDAGTFSNCSGLKSITIPNSVTSIRSFAFQGCYGLTSIAISNNVTRIESSAFSYCSNLSSISIPESVTDIGSHAFEGCSSLKSITCEAKKVPYLGMNVFHDDFSRNTMVLYVLGSAINDYKSAFQWKDFTRILPIDAEPI